MNKNKVRDIVIISLIILVFVVVVVVNHNSRKSVKVVDDIKFNPNFVYIEDLDEDLDIDDNYVFTNYTDYFEVFNSNVLTEKDFENYNYALIRISYDTCTDRNITPTDYNIEDENINVTFKYYGSCGVCVPGYKYYLLKIDKSMTKVKIDTDYIMVNEIACDPYVSYKPLIYLYPEEETKVEVKLGYPNLLTTTYPKYKNSWNVLALPDGSLYDENGKYYYGLYWEGINNIDEEFDDGFVVSKEDTIKFLEDKLSILGLNDREINEFIVYWLPILEKNNYNLIRFADNDVINSEMPLDINPKSDTIIRVLMEYKPLDDKINIKEQPLTKVERVGFTVVEWGGTLIK